jgi:hypothetical protein
VSKGGTGTTAAPTQGGIIYGASATQYGCTAAGTSGQILKSNGSSAPTWVNLSSLGDSRYALKSNGIYYVTGNTSGTAGTWTGSNTAISDMYAGLTIAY